VRVYRHRCNPPRLISLLLVTPLYYSPSRRSLSALNPNRRSARTVNAFITASAISVGRRVRIEECSSNAKMADNKRHNASGKTPVATPNVGSSGMVSLEAALIGAIGAR